MPSPNIAHYRRGIQVVWSLYFLHTTQYFSCPDRAVSSLYLHLYTWSQILREYVPRCLDSNIFHQKDHFWETDPESLQWLLEEFKLIMTLARSMFENTHYAHIGDFIPLYLRIDCVPVYELSARFLISTIDWTIVIINLKNYKLTYSFLSLSSTFSNTSKFHHFVFSLFFSTISELVTYHTSRALKDSVADCHIREAGESLSRR